MILPASIWTAHDEKKNHSTVLGKGGNQVILLFIPEVGLSKCLKEVHQTWFQCASLPTAMEGKGGPPGWATGLPLLVCSLITTVALILICQCFKISILVWKQEQKRLSFVWPPAAAAPGGHSQRPGKVLPHRGCRSPGVLLLTSHDSRSL